MRDGGIWLDLWEANRRQLLAAGVEGVFGAGGVLGMRGGCERGGGGTFRTAWIEGLRGG